MPTNNPTIVGDDSVLWGTDGYYGSALITSGNKKLDGDKLEVKDNNGYVIAVIYFNDKNEFSFEMIVQTAAPALARGDRMTIAGVADALFESSEEKWNNGEERKLSVTATRYLGMTVA